MKYLIVYAHPNPKSFNHAVLEGIEKALNDAGKEYGVRDLYALKFDPSLNRKDLSLLLEGKVAAEIEKEQRYVKEAGALIFIYPIWWFGMPAIMKGYIDRVFAEGFAFAIEGDDLKGLLDGKKVFIFNTTGAPRDSLVSSGYEDAMKKITDMSIFRFCGMEVAAHKYFYAVPSVDEAARKRMLEEISQIAF